MGYGKKNNSIIKIDNKDIQDVVNGHTTQLAKKAKQIENNAIDITNMPEDFAYASAKGDGSDETVTLQRILDYITNNHKAMLIPQGKTFVTADLYIIGANNFGILGYGTLKRKSGAANQSILSLRGCTDVYIPLLNTDGNVSGNGGTVQEGQHSVSILENSGTPSENIVFGIFSDKNPSGDTLYIKNGNKITIDTLKSISDAGTGRNGLSIIKGDTIVIDKVISLNTGYPGMPGGVDLEPNLNTDNISNVKINYILVTTYGTDGLQLANSIGASVSDIEINGSVTKTNSPTNYVCAINKVNRFKGNLKLRQIGTSVSDAILISDSTDIDLTVNSDNSKRGALITGLNTLTSFILKGKITSTTQEGIAFNGNFKGLVDAEIKDTSTSGSGGTIYVSSSSTASGVTFRGDFSKGTYGQSCFRFEGTVTNFRAENVDMTGWPDSYRVYGANAGTGGFFAVNCPNYNYRSALPAGTDGYTQGVIVWNTSSIASGKIGWVVTTSGKPGTIKAFGVIDA